MKKTKFNEKFLDFLVCPKTGEQLIYDKNKNILLTKDRRNSYKILDGVPRLIVDE